MYVSILTELLNTVAAGKFVNWLPSPLKYDAVTDPDTLILPLDIIPLRATNSFAILSLFHCPKVTKKGWVGLVPTPILLVINYYTARTPVLTDQVPDTLLNFNRATPATTSTTKVACDVLPRSLVDVSVNSFVLAFHTVITVPAL